MDKRERREGASARFEEASQWFDQPRRLLPAPETFVRSFQQKPTRAYRPAALPSNGSAEAMPAPSKRKKASTAEEESMLRVPHTRYHWEGSVVVVPVRCEDLDESFHDADNELLLVELFQGSWLEDPSVAFVHVTTEQGAAKLLPASDLRAYVRANQEVFKKPLLGLKKLNYPFRCRRCPQQVFLPVALSELAAGLERAAAAPLPPTSESARD